MPSFMPTRRRPLILLGVGLLGLTGFVLWWQWHHRDAPRAAQPMDGDQEFELDPAKQKYIWDTEHISFELETHFCKAFSRALKENREQGLLALTRAGFKGHLL